MLNQEQRDALLRQFDVTVGCPVNVTDRLDGFIRGAVAMMQMLVPLVTIDDGSAPPTPPDPVPLAAHKQGAEANNGAEKPPNNGNYKKKNYAKQ